MNENMRLCGMLISYRNSDQFLQLIIMECVQNLDGQTEYDELFCLQLNC